MLVWRSSPPVADPTTSGCGSFRHRGGRGDRSRHRSPVGSGARREGRQGHWLGDRRQADRRRSGCHLRRRSRPKGGNPRRPAFLQRARHRNVSVNDESGNSWGATVPRQIDHRRYGPASPAATLRPVQPTSALAWSEHHVATTPSDRAIQPKRFVPGPGRPTRPRSRLDAFAHAPAGTADRRGPMISLPSPLLTSSSSLQASLTPSTFLVSRAPVAGDVALTYSGS